MLPVRCFAMTALLVAALVPAASVPSRADERAPPGCLTRDQRRDLVASHDVVPLTTATRAARAARGGRARGEVIRASLCRGPNGLIYRLTVLARDGKVTRLTVDAASGKLVGGH